ncbi:MAG: hypothetical protein AB1489_17245 [Acidobacteriota bacterium]
MEKEYQNLNPGEETRPCQICHSNNQVTAVGDRYICDCCRDKLFRRCVRCDEYTMIKETTWVLVSDERRPLCQACQSKLGKTTCRICRGALQWQQAFQFGICESCLTLPELEFY